MRAWLLGMLFLLAGTHAAAQGTDQILNETFDGVMAPALPPGWSVSNGAWETSGSSASSGSGLNNVFSRGSASGELTMPTIDLTGAMSAEITYLARRTSSYDLSNLRIMASTDGGITFPLQVAAPGDALPVAASTYESVALPLPAALLGQPSVTLRFEALGNSSASANARIDDVSVTALRLVIVSPTTLSFVAMPGGSDMATTTLTNADASSLQVNAPFVGGAAYSVFPMGQVTLAPGASQVYTVTWSPLISGSDDRTLLLVHEHGSASVSLEGRTAGGLLGFHADSSRTVAGDSLHGVPLRLAFDDAAGLQGLQFTMRWDDPDFALRDVRRGADVADSLTWTLSYTADSTRATVVLLGAGTSALATGTRDSLLTLVFTLPDTSSAAQSLRLSLENVVGALALPGGDDAGIVARPDSHTVVLERGEAVFALSDATLALSPALVGDTSTAVVTISNPGGTIPLVVYPVTSDNPLFTLTPDSLVVPPDSAVAVDVAFAPVDSAFGLQHALIVFSHNGAGATDTLQVDAVGEGGRGDAARDGVVDVVDLVQVLDFVLLRTAPDSLQLSSADLYPFPDGDGELDVRDLTVLSQAIVNAQWPDSVALPPVGTGATGSSLLIADGAGEVTGEIAIRENWTLALETDVPVRALQAVLRASAVGAVRAVGKADSPASMVTVFTRTASEVRVICYRADGGLIEAGIHELLEIEPAGDGARVEPLYAIGVDGDLKRVPVAVAGVEGEDAESEVPGDILRLGVPYPNPVRFAGEERLRLPLAGRPSDGRSRAAVFNILGQRVRRLDVPEQGEMVLEWDGRDQRGGLVSPGIYFFRLEGVRSTVRSAVVVR